MSLGLRGSKNEKEYTPPTPEVQSNTKSDSKNGKLKQETTRRKKPDIKEAVAGPQGNKREKVTAAAAAAAADIVADAATTAAAAAATAATTAAATAAAAADAAATAASTAADDAAANTAAAATTAANAAFTTAAAAAAAVAAIVENAAANERYNRSLLEASLDPLIVISPDGKITDVNKATETTTGYSRKKLIGTEFAEYFTEPDKARESYEEVFSKGLVRDYPLIIKHKLGQHTDVMYNATVYRNGAGEVEGVFAAVRDVTELRKYEGNVKRLNRELQGQITQLTAANEELEAFSYAVSHDLRAPLRSIDGFSQILTEDYSENMDEQALDYLTRIRAATKRMGQLIDDMLKLSRVTRGEMRFEKIDLSALASEVAKQKKHQYPDVNVEVIIANGLEAFGDKGLAEVALDNLFDNAWKFTSLAEKPVIEFGCRHLSGEDLFFVKDNGVGFDQAYVNKLFKPFQRLHHEKEFPGTGIGLATVQRIVNRHGGRTIAESTTDRGAIFYFSLASVRSKEERNESCEG